MRNLNKVLMGLICLSLVSLFACTPKQEEKTVVVTDAWARATFALAQTGAVYLTLNNSTGSDLHLISASVDEDIAQEAQLHDMLMSEGMMKMEEIENGIVIADAHSQSFAPGGKHIMLLGLKGALEAGESFELRLNFENHASVPVVINIKDARNL